MEKDNLIKTLKENKTVTYELTGLGKSYLDQKMKVPDKELWSKISKLKLGSERLGYKGLLRYVYFNYPNFIDKSKIKKEVLGS
jgi:DNA-binding PadR family transcriptional regulator